jgi:SMODS-associated and fused to various effectors sensor domain
VARVLALNPFGRYFISYRRSRADEVAVVRRALRERGIPTWLDTTDLSLEATPEELQYIIRHPDTTGAIIVVSPEVETSLTIRELEVPEIVRQRQLYGRSFLIAQILTGGLRYSDVTRIYGQQLALDHLAAWNAEKAGDSQGERSADSIQEPDAARFADSVLRTRLHQIADRTQADEPIRIALNTRVAASFDGRSAITMDWSEWLAERLCATDVWNERLLPALHSVSNAVRMELSARPLIASGLLAIPAAIALGSTFSVTSGLDLRWSQYTVGDVSEWSLRVPPQHTELTVEARHLDLGGRDLVALVSVSQDVKRAASLIYETLPRVRALLDFRVEQIGSDITAGIAVSIAREVRKELIRLRTERGADGTVHLFYAGPVGLAMLLGQLLNSIGPIQTYEFNPQWTPAYKPSLLLRSA